MSKEPDKGKCPDCGHGWDYHAWPGCTHQIEPAKKKTIMEYFGLRVETCGCTAMTHP